MFPNEEEVLIPTGTTLLSTGYKIYDKVQVFTFMEISDVTDNPRLDVLPVINYGYSNMDSLDHHAELSGLNHDEL